MKMSLTIVALLTVTLAMPAQAMRSQDAGKQSVQTAKSSDAATFQVAAPRGKGGKKKEGG